VFETRSALSGRIRVIDDGRERRLMAAGDTLSVYPLDGDWSLVRREYWWRALAAVDLPPRPTALLVGLGGGTQVHLLQQRRSPRAITVIERDPAIVRVATAWFGLSTLRSLEFLCDDADRVVPWLVRARRRFDFVMEDAAYAEAPARAMPLALALVPLVAPGGVLVVNRHRRRDAGRLAAALRPHFHDVRLRRVRREAENVLVCCAGPRQAVGNRLYRSRWGRSASAPTRLRRSAS
jgi:spermidine synthase